MHRCRCRCLCSHICTYVCLYTQTRAPAHKRRCEPISRPECIKSGQVPEAAALSPRRAAGRRRVVYRQPAASGPRLRNRRRSDDVEDADLALLSAESPSAGALDYRRNWSKRASSAHFPQTLCFVKSLRGPGSSKKIGSNVSDETLYNLPSSASTQDVGRTKCEDGSFEVPFETSVLFSICARHARARAMLMLSVSFQLHGMISVEYPPRFDVPRFCGLFLGKLACLNVSNDEAPPLARRVTLGLRSTAGDVPWRGCLRGHPRTYSIRCLRYINFAKCSLSWMIFIHQSTRLVGLANDLGKYK